MVRIEDDTDLVPIRESPVLDRLGLIQQETLGSDGLPVKAGEWVRQRIIKNLGTSADGEADNLANDVEIVPGVKTKYFD